MTLGERMKRLRQERGESMTSGNETFSCVANDAQLADHGVVHTEGSSCNRCFCGRQAQGPASLCVRPHHS